MRFCAAVPAFYRAFGFGELSVALSTRPAERAGDDALWDRAEAALEAVLRRLGGSFKLQPGAGAFHGPKIEYSLRDRQGRDWQCGTIQFDLVMPARFELQYVDGRGARRRPVMLHRALYGSLERFLGILLEHHGAALPPWLAPVQVLVLPVSAAERAAAQVLAARFGRAGVRAAVEADDSLSRRIARAHTLAVPFQAVIGPREAGVGEVTLRARGEGPQGTLPVAAALAELAPRCEAPAFFEAPAVAA